MNSSRACRTVTSVGLLGIAGTHLYAGSAQQYFGIPTIGVLFGITVATALVLSIVTSAIDLWPAYGVDVLMAVGVLAGYLAAFVVPGGVFQFSETHVTGVGALSIGAEIVTVLGAATTLLVRRRAAHA